MTDRPKPTRAQRIRALAAEGKDLTVIRAAFRRRRLAEVSASEYHHAIKNGGRPVGRPTKRTLRAGCEELVRQWRRNGDVGLSANAAAEQLQKLLEESSR